MSTLRAYLIPLLQALVLFAVLSAAVDWWRSPEQPVQSADKPLLTLTRHTTSLAELSRDQTAVLYFWGSWCGICRYTSPVIEDLHQAGIPVLSIALNSGNDATVGSYLQQHSFHFPTVNDADGSLSRQWQVGVTPTIILIKNGKMVHHTTGLSSYWGLRGRIWLADKLS
ncbi:protein disulfide oxidoreductase [Neisseria animalis]|uniref:Protein disulfide oxidoreductase n=1 Tax=Neisseria animalis TaxID=492 RepID=A0A5P3MRC3_NEIAN|nr:protein disulfide oxidoreductase [Neisseria animalis]QEY24078.1 protein disulfide oxidoreductase [Neisseria animalis]ROW32646.1 protein disulfide oxidoreductase [Neisseria animalis]VEE06226.1 periplasmic thioredoxin [Neisseria animalis]